MLVEIARVEEVGSSGNVSSSEKVVLVLLAVECRHRGLRVLGSCHRGGFSVVLSRCVP